MGTIASLLTSAGLGAGAGINSYATLLVLGLFARFQPQWFTDEVARFFASTPVLIAVGVLYAIEFVADKIPAVDHVWDVIHTFIRPLAGAAAAWGAAAPGMPKGALVLAAVLGGSAALSTHAVKASVRAASTVTTAGCANPLLSLLEDVFAFVNAILVILLPGLVVVTIGLLILFFLRVRRRQLNDVGRPT